MRLRCFQILTGLINAVSANVQKVIFLGSDIVPADIHAALDGLDVLKLSPSQNLLRLHLPVAFPTSSEPKGLQSWYLLDNLTPWQRYEVRVCWAAIQPSDFSLYAHTFSDVLGDVKLLESLTDFSQAQTYEGSDAGEAATSYAHLVDKGHSPLLLQIFAAADYFSTNQTLMSTPPPVYVDIILDPFVFNIVPQSLLPTIGNIAFVGVVGWFIAGFIWRCLRDLDLDGKKEARQE